ncbi:Hypothetical predicted protein [Xyrichtys novacula]|uniref:Uncharacterized protein n=1 Tax=Xyrichtys novacula TaxID=13765 RepID=A0AAV1EYY6_XYRNO|nr:Hypothetical predicted protein [Xyrichtys novacula]
MERFYLRWSSWLHSTPTWGKKGNHRRKGRAVGGCLTAAGPIEEKRDLVDDSILELDLEDASEDEEEQSHQENHSPWRLSAPLQLKKRLI